jgi:plasmid maintenance system antidote protein VapI
MTTSQTQSFLTEILEGERIPVGKLEYFRARLQSRLHQLVLAEFLRQEDLHQAELARRIGRKPEAVNRLLGAPGNWTLNTVSDLLLGMGTEPELAIEHLSSMTAQDTGNNLIEGMRTGQSANTVPISQSPRQGHIEVRPLG